MLRETNINKKSLPWKGNACIKENVVVRIHLGNEIINTGGHKYIQIKTATKLIVAAGVKGVVYGKTLK